MLIFPNFWQIGSRRFLLRFKYSPEKLSLPQRETMPDQRYFLINFYTCLVYFFILVEKLSLILRQGWDKKNFRTLFGGLPETRNKLFMASAKADPSGLKTSNSIQNLTFWLKWNKSTIIKFSYLRWLCPKISFKF